ncbi:glycoside hydrolase family 172 protein [Streptomyces sp. NPDC087440]|uniref:glycoside hydrolase family 172 protein n=1 Tax=Streptomyces sp. NPDC087440 TaxID=3365790 RepID=UPI003806878B
MRRAPALWAAFLCVALLAMAMAVASGEREARDPRGNDGAKPGGVRAATTAPAGKGPVGWETYRRLDLAAHLPRGVETKMFSSFDRQGGNWDGFGGVSSCLPIRTKECVIAEHVGAGEISSIWFTRWLGPIRDTGLTGSFAHTGRITVELDGRKVVDAPLADVLAGKLGAPFTHPLVADDKQTSGGALISVPMPYRESMRVTTERDPRLYQVMYRTFADAQGVSTFDPGESAQDVVDLMSRAPAADPKPTLAGTTEQVASLRLAPGETQRLAHSTVPGLIGGLRLRLPQTVAPKPQPVTDSGRAYGRGGGSEFGLTVDPANRGVVLTRRLDRTIGGQRARVYVDGELAGEWPGSPRAAERWGEESLELPAALTAGKSRLAIRTEWSAGQDFNEFTYWARPAGGVAGAATDTVDVGDPASELSHGYRIRGAIWLGTRAYNYPTPDTGPEATSRKLLHGLRLRATFDGVRTVDAPLGEFFGSGYTMAPVRSLMFQLDSASGEFTAWWPMPYAREATVEVYNGSQVNLREGTSWVRTTPSTAHARAVREGTEGHFRATSHASATVLDRSWEFLSTQGSGKVVGVSHSMRGDGGRVHMEGDERMFVDDSHTPQVHGTGTEDFYRGGWYFLHGTYSAPLNGHPARLTDGSGCGAAEDCSSAYRLLLTDAVPFGRSMRFTIEHGLANEAPATYAATTYWYGQQARRLHRTHTVSAALTVSHSPRVESGGFLSTLEVASTFEGELVNPERHTAKVFYTRRPVTLEVTVDPANEGVVLRRTGDQLAAGQRARVSVDGTVLPDWYQPLGNHGRRWLEDSYQLPAAATRGKRRISVTLTPVQGAPEWAAAQYTADSVVG